MLFKSDRLEEAVDYYSNLLLSFPGDTNALFFLFEAIKGQFKEKLGQEFCYSKNFLKQCLQLMCVSKIVAFGDSHVLLLRVVMRLN